MTVKELLQKMSYDMEAAGDTCTMTEGAQGCEEAQELQHIIGVIEKYLDNQGEV